MAVSEKMAEIVFWILSGLVGYVYAGYPLALMLVARMSRGGDLSSDGAAQPELPKVSLLISAYNEAGCIGEKLENTLALDYPRDRLEVLVVSDASNDGTDEIVQRYAARGVRLLRMPQRGGKTLGLNAAVAQVSGEIVVFSDANALYRSDALLRLTAPFADPRVGAVIGESTYLDSASESARSESLYWRYETWIKELESRTGSVVGGDGAIYAVRRTLYEPMAADALSDFVNPLQVVRAGYRCVYEPAAVSYEEAAADFRREYRRKVRIVNRAWRALLSMREILNPFRYGAFALKLWSHKVLRWLVPVFLAGILIANAGLLSTHPFYTATFVLQGVFYALAAVGLVLRRRPALPSIIRVPFYFCMVNFAAAVGLLEAARGKTYTTWTTARA